MHHNIFDIYISHNSSINTTPKTPIFITKYSPSPHHLLLLPLMAQPKILLFLNLFLALSSDAMAAYNIINFGAKPDGRTDSAKAFLRAWAAACSSKTPASIYVPSGKFLVSQALFNGPCKNAAIKITIDGTIFAPSGYSSMTDWVTFKYVQGLSISGGVLDGRGQAFWACKMAGKNCPQGASVNFLLSSILSNFINTQVIFP